MYTDPISDYLTRVRNAQMAEHRVVDIPASNMKKSITKILHDKGYILDYKFEDTTNNQGNINHCITDLMHSKFFPPIDLDWFFVALTQSAIEYLRPHSNNMLLGDFNS